MSEPPSNVVPLFNDESVLNETWNRLRAVHERIERLFHMGQHNPPTEAWRQAQVDLAAANEEWRRDCNRDPRFRGVVRR